MTNPSPSYTILLIHNRYQYAGGEDTVVRNEQKLLTDHGHRVLLYEKNNTELNQYTKLQKLLLPFRTLFSLQSYRELCHMIQENHVDIVHVHNTLPLISFSCYYAAKKSGCRLFQTLHNFRLICPNGILFRDGQVCEECLHKNLACSIRHSCYRNSRVQSLLVAAQLMLHRILGTFRLPDAYIALTPFNKNIILQKLPQATIAIKPNFNPTTSNATLLQPSIQKKRSDFLFLSRMEESKGVFVLLEAFRRLPNIHLTMVGSGPLEEEVRLFLATHHMTHVTFLGQQTHEIVMELLYHAKALLFPTLWYEGFPMTIAESFSLGTPIIGSNLGNVASIVAHQKTGLLFEPGSSTALCKSIQTFVAADFPIDALEEACLNTYQKYYTPEANYVQLMAIYEGTPSHSLL